MSYKILLLQYKLRERFNNSTPPPCYVGTGGVKQLALLIGLTPIPRKTPIPRNNQHLSNETSAITEELSVFELFSLNSLIA